jgi:hypothetical protein
MTALADIGKAAAHLHGDSLRGSDLSQFNEAHPRDEGGRFAAVDATPSLNDPRIERMARRKRRMKRAVRASSASAQAQQAVQADPRVNLERLAQRRANVEREPVQRRNEPVQRKGEKAAKTGPKAEIDLTDESYARPSEGTTDIDSEVIIPMSQEQVDEFLRAGAMNVGAANAKWGTSLTGHMTDGQEQSIASQRLREQVNFENPYQHELVAVRLKQRFRTVSSGDDQESFVLASAHVLTPAGTDFITVHEKPGGITEDDDYAPPSGKSVLIPVVDVVVSKEALETWDDDEHPRDFDTGRFVSTRISSDTPPTIIDPRVARGQRRKRRLKRASVAREATSHRAAPTDVRMRERAPQERHNERIELQRRNARWLAAQENRTKGLRLTPAEEEKLAEEIFAAGPQIRSWAGIDPRDDPSRIPDVVGPPRKIHGGKVVEEEREPAPPSVLRETERLEAVPFLYDESGALVRTPEVEAAIARQKARVRAHARKVKRSRS